MSLSNTSWQGTLALEMNVLQPSAKFGSAESLPPAAVTPHPPTTTTIALFVLAAGLIYRGSPAIALVAGTFFALLVGNPFAHGSQRITKWLLQGCVVLLGFGMNLPEVLRLGLNGSLFAAATIASTLALGRWLGRKMELGQKTSTLISAGTAICGGSAIAAVSSVIAASEAEIAVSIGTVFLLNAGALYVFPFVGQLLHLSQSQFGLWAGVAIHDISSVVGAGLSYGPEALQTAVAVKLSRTLWIVPLTLMLGLGFGAQDSTDARSKDSPHRAKLGTGIPWFIALFLLASLLRSYVPVVNEWSPVLSGIAQRGMCLVLFLIGTSFTLRSLRLVGGRTILTGLTLWLFTSVSSLLVIVLLFPSR